MRSVATLLCLLALSTACTNFPELDAAEPAEAKNSDYPSLLPLDQLLAAPDPIATPEVLEGVQSRVQALKSRANRLRGPVVDRATKARMARGVRVR